MLAYMLSSGEPVIANAWSTCMRERGGFYVWFWPRQGGAEIVSVEFQSPNDRDQKFKLSDVQWAGVALNGSRIEMSPIKAECLAPGRVYKAGDTCSFALSTVDASTGVLLVVNGKYTSKGGTAYAVDAFLPPNMKWSSVSSRVVTSLLKPPVVTSKSKRYQKSGSVTYPLDEVCIDRAQIGGNSVLFVASTAQTSPSAHCRLAPTGESLRLLYVGIQPSNQILSCIMLGHLILLVTTVMPQLGLVRILPLNRSRLLRI